MPPGHCHQHFCFRFGTKLQLFHPFDRFFFIFQFSIKKSSGNSPAFLCGCISSHLPEGFDASESFKSIVISTEDFSTPDGPIRSVTGTVKGNADHRIFTVIFRHAGQDMCKMMLYLQDRKSKFFSNDCRIVFRMQITRHNLWFCLQERFQSADRFCQSLHGTQIFQISHVRGRIKSAIYANTERIFQFSSGSKHLAFPRHLNHGRKWCVAPGSANHIWLIFIKIHHRIIGTDPDLPVMGKHTVTQMGKLLNGFFILPADWCTGCIPTGHNQKRRHLDSIIIGEDQKLHRSVRQHHTNLWIARCNTFAKRFFSVFFFVQKQDRLLMSGQDLFLFFTDQAFSFHRLQIFRHDCKWLRRTLFEFPKPSHRFFICCITTQMEASDSLDRYNASFCDDPSGINDRIPPAFFSSDQIDLRSALITADRLCIVSPGRRIIIFFRTVRTHRKFFHTGAFPVIRKGIQDRKTRTTAGTVDKWMQISAVLRIKHFFLAFITNCNIR